MKEKDVRKIGNKMDKSKAKKWVKKYQDKNPKAEVYGWLFGREIIESLCKYDSLEGIWFFKGINDDGEEKLVMFPADKKGNILDKKFRSLGAAAARDGGLGDDDPADDSESCPPYCPEGLGG